MYRLYNGVKENRKKDENIKDETIQTKLQADTHNNNQKGKKIRHNRSNAKRQKGKKERDITTAVSGDSSWILMSAA